MTIQQTLLFDKTSYCFKKSLKFSNFINKSKQDDNITLFVYTGSSITKSKLILFYEATLINEDFPYDQKYCNKTSSHIASDSYNYLHFLPCSTNWWRTSLSIRASSHRVSIGVSLSYPYFSPMLCNATGLGTINATV